MLPIQKDRKVGLHFFKWFVSIVCLLTGFMVKGQPYPEIELDMLAGTTLQPVPFDEFFIVKGQLPDLTKVKFIYRPDPANASRDVPYNGTPDPATGNFRILVKELLPGSKNIYNFKLQYERRVNPADVQRLRDGFIDNVRDYLIRDESFIASRRTITRTTIQNFQTQLQRAIPTNLSGETIRVIPGSLLDETSNVLAGSQLFTVDLVENVRQRRSDIDDLLEDIDGVPARGIVSLADLTNRLFTLRRLTKLSASKNEEVAATASAMLTNLSDAVNCFVTGGLFIKAGLSENCDRNEFESMDPTVLTRKAVNYSRHLAFLSAVRSELIASRDRAGVALLDEIQPRLSAYPPRVIGIRTLNERREELLNDLSKAIAVSIVRDIAIEGSNDGTLTTRAQWYVSMDAGLLYAPQIDQLVPYIGANIYFSPVKKNTSFARLRAAGRNLFPYRFAVVVGFTPTNLSQDTRFRTDVVGGRAGLVGVGWRLTEFLRVGGGTLIIRQKDLNPLITQYQLRLTPFISVSADIDVVALFRPRFN